MATAVKEVQAPVAEDNDAGVILNEERYASDYTTGTHAGKTIVTGVGYVKGIVLGSPTLTSVVTLYDSLAASGTVICKLTPITGMPCFIPLNRELAVGLTLVVATAGSDVTVEYRA